MGLSEPLLIAVGIAGVIFMLYAFNAMNLLKGWTRILAISSTMLVVVLLSSRLFNSRPLTPNLSANSFWDWLPRQESTIQNPGLAQTGWQDLPMGVVFGILLDAFDSSQPQPSVSPLPVSPLPPSLSPSLPPSPTVPPAVAPPAAIPPAAIPPAITPPTTAPPTVIQPAPPPSPVQPSLPPNPQPSPTQPPVSAWW